MFVTCGGAFAKLDPEFDPEMSLYTVNVNNDMDSVLLTPFTTHDGASFEVSLNGQPLKDTVTDEFLVGELFPPSRTAAT